MVAEREPGVYQLLDRQQPQFSKPNCVGLSELLETAVQHGPSPEPQRRLQLGRAAGGIAGGKGVARFGQEALEPEGIDVVGVDGEQVPGLAREQDATLSTAR